MTDTDLAPDRRDAADPLASFRDRFVPAPDVVAYLDGNSLGRPPALTAERIERFVREDWGTRLIRGWDEGWWEQPGTLGDRIGALALGAAPGQTVVADSTTVLFYKLARAAVTARPGRREIVLDTDNFPTDRYVVEGIAAERGLTLRWVETDPATGITPEQVADAVGPDTALVTFSHVAYRSGWVADAAAITAVAHDAGALALWDLSHSAGSVPLQLDAWGVDLAVGCTYKYLCGGPGSPAFGYARRDLLPDLDQPIQGWTGRRDPFAMAAGYEPEPGVRRLLSGTPPVLAMLPLTVSLDMLAEAGIDAVREKSLRLTDYALALTDAWLVPRGVTVASPREHARRGGHVTLVRPGFAELLAPLWDRGVIPDFRAPDGLRIGLSPLSTSFAEVHAGLSALRDLIG
ncbi:aminotransferase class V-fold PLP-dependent enzyme [Pseudonocardia sp. KRD291]|uniref:kynureninase n=1 Tax=Pseudonocardia sp. KRD291 TaxID=2792007 RepID=UPI001C4A6DEF|nr:aminotransferase class V-fold PLP-dependent enzyme [Pseudonocardia sp. KRD291]MBW0101357.1 aminotransferase class V-fold PLP-dependent enzyme [Pseudonocardia sp. KRD291]